MSSILISDQPQDDLQPRIVKASNGTLLAFQYDGDNYLSYKMSTDGGGTWGDWVVVWESDWYGYWFAVAIDASDNIYICYDASTYANDLTVKKLTYTGSNTWSIGSEVTALTHGDTGTNHNYPHPYILCKSNGDVWISSPVKVGSSDNTKFTAVYSTNGGSSFSQTSVVDCGSGMWIRADNDVPLYEVGSDIWAFAAKGSTTSGSLFQTIYTSGAWGSPAVLDTVVNNGAYLGIKGCVISSTEVYIAYNKTTTAGLWIKKWNGSSWDSGTQLSTGAYSGPVAISNVNSHPVVSWIDYSGTNIIKYSYFDSTWSSPATIADSETNNLASQSSVLVSTDGVWGCVYYTYEPGFYFFGIELFSTPVVDEELDWFESIVVNEGWGIHSSNDPIAIDETINLSDEWVAIENPQTEVLDNSIKITDAWDVHVTFEIIKFNTDLRWLQTYKEKIATSLAWLLGKKISTDLRWLKVYKPAISTDLRWLSVGYNDVPPIAPADIQIFINSVDMAPLNEVDLQTGNIVHTAGQKSIATFTLARKHDDLDRTHTGATSQITNQNPVQIYIKGHLEFDGKISNLSVNSDTETIQVTCQMNEPSDNRHTIELPLPSVNEKIHLYHCLVNNVQMDNPYIDPGEDNPEYYKGVKVDLGTKITQQTDTWREIEYTIDGKGMIATEVEEGTYITKPNYSYFWAVLVKNIRTGIQSGDMRYIGTSLAATTTDLWAIMGACPTRQKIKDNIETELGFYYLGSAPYKEISCKNGQLVIAGKYQDRDNGLYNIYDSSYNYVNFAKLVAGLEYQKLLTVGGQVVPVSSANIDITFDAYYYYTVKLLTRINVTNTTVANTFKNTNGFPVSVKGISINFSTMKVSLSTDNRLSQEELDEIDAQMPDENSSLYVVPERAVLVYRKFDLKTWAYVS